MKGLATGLLITPLLAITATPAASADPAPSTSPQQELAPAGSQKAPVELLGAATETTRFWKHPDGHVTSEIWSRPVRVKQHSAWAWIDPTLVEQNGTVKPKVIKGDLALSAGGGTGPFTTFSPNSQQSLALSWPTELPKPTLKGSRAIYTDAAGPGIDLVVTALPTGFRQDVVLRTRPEKAPELEIPVNAKGLKLAEASDGRLRLTDKDGQSVATALKPDMRDTVDSKDSDHTGKRGTVDVKVRTEGGRQTLLITPDSGFLSAPATVYPVTLSSAFSVALTADTDVNSAYDFNNVDGPAIKAGTESSGEKARTYLKFDLSSLTGQNVSNATLSLLNIDGPSCGTKVGAGIQVRRVTSAWNPSTITWSPQPTNTTENAVINTSSVDDGVCDPAPMNWDITAIARQWTGEAGNYGLVLMSPSETKSANSRVFPSSEDTDFNSPPKLTATFTPVEDPTVVNPAGSDGVEVFTAPNSWGTDALPMAEAQAHALSSAQDRVDTYPAALAPPHLDMVTGQIIVPAATAEGRDLGSAVLNGTAYLSNGATDWTISDARTGTGDYQDGEGLAGETETYSFSPQIPDATNSAERLNTIADEVLSLDATQLPGADKLLAARVWPQRNQVLLQATAVTPELRLALAQRYGTNTTAIWLRPGASHPVADVDSRNNPTENGYIEGGALYRPINGGSCTTAFSWGGAGKNFITTAGHCVPRAKDPNDIGITSLGLREESTWDDGVGSVKIPGQPTTYGDAGLIDISIQRRIPSIFIGGVNSSTWSPVASQWYRRSQDGDQYCVGGALTGQTCGWKVTHIGWKVQYKKAGLTETVRWVNRAVRVNRCNAGGDSGAPIYTIRSHKGHPDDGSVIAKGIHSGSEKDAEGNTKTADCVSFFTDIMDVSKAFGGQVLKWNFS
ncbi:DNRLRE domain-containing protein [Streptosporangium canum]|uniref:DNRLRE domain-containing protein n=1 Tax=Streptosporangium canum TaxID=324952 RepID=UPI0034435E12